MPINQSICLKWVYLQFGSRILKAVVENLALKLHTASAGVWYTCSGDGNTFSEEGALSFKVVVSSFTYKKIAKFTGMTSSLNTT